MKWNRQILTLMLISLSLVSAVRAEDAPVSIPVPAPALVQEEALTSSAEPAPEASKSKILFGNAVKKLRSGEILSVEEYRALNAGCCGFESHHAFFQDLSTITAVYKGSPAYQAGIRVGDQIVAPEPVEDAKFQEHPTFSRTKVKCGRAGTPVDITVLRDGKPVKLTVLRMNIEDIREPRYRHSWEQILQQLGYPEGGEFSGASLEDLMPTNE